MTFDDSQLNRASNMEIAAYISREISQFHNRVCYLKEMIGNLTSIEIMKEEVGAIAGQLYLNQDVINISQLALLKKSINASKLDENLYTVFTLVAGVLRDSHPSSWMDDHNALYSFFENLLDKEEDKKILAEAKDLAIEHQVKVITNFQPYTPVKGVSNGVVFI